MTTTAPITFTILDIERVHGRGKLLAFVSVEISASDLEFTVQGLQLQRHGTGTVLTSPTFRRADGASCPSVILPAELLTAIATELATDLRWRSG